MGRVLPLAPQRTRQRLRRVAAALSALAVLVGSLTFGRAVVAHQGWWYDGFISEAGEPGSPQATGYRTGILVIAAGLVLLGTAVGVAATHLFVWAAAGLLLAAGALAGTSGLVACSVGCPLPPYETPTAGDLIHAGSSVAGLLACGAAMLALAFLPEPGRVRAVSRAWLVLTVPVGLVAGINLTFLGKGTLTGASEKLLLVVITSWVLVVAVLSTVDDSSPSRSRGS